MTVAAQNVTRFVSVVMGIVIGLTFMFGFGNVPTLALSLGVPLTTRSPGWCCTTSDARRPGGDLVRVRISATSIGEPRPGRA